MPRIFCLVDAADALDLLPDLACAGITGFQVRAKGLPDRELLALTQLVIGATRPHGATVVVDDRVDVALASGADGVHVGADDLPVASVRRIAPDLLVGATCRNVEQVERAAGDGADYAGFGPVCRSHSKRGLPEPLGMDAVRAAAAGPLPLVAIGGLGPATASGVREAGAYGVAVIGAVWRHPDPVAAAKELVARVG